MTTHLHLEGVADEAAVEFGADDDEGARVDVLGLAVGVVDLLQHRLVVGHLLHPWHTQGLSVNNISRVTIDWI